MDMPNTTPPTLDSAALEDKYRRAAGRAWGNFGFYLGASNDNLDAIRALDPLKAPGIKVFMGASTGNMLVDDPQILDAIFREAPTPIITHLRRHADDRREPRRLQGEFRRRRSGRVPPDIRSREACIKSTRLALELARRHGTQLHVLHISTADELALFEQGPLIRAGRQPQEDHCRKPACTSCASRAVITRALAT
jgi:dihydroorotase